MSDLYPDLAYRVTVVTAFELALGRSYARAPAPVDALLAVPCLPLDRAAGLRAGSLLRDLRSAGAAVDLRDAMQAGICLASGARLVTRNIAHFARVPGLELSHPDALLGS